MSRGAPFCSWASTHHLGPSAAGCSVLAMPSHLAARSRKPADSSSASRVAAVPWPCGAAHHSTQWPRRPIGQGSARVTCSHLAAPVAPVALAGYAASTDALWIPPAAPSTAWRTHVQPVRRRSRGGRADLAAWRGRLRRRDGASCTRRQPSRGCGAASWLARPTQCDPVPTRGRGGSHRACCWPLSPAPVPSSPRMRASWPRSIPCAPRSPAARGAAPTPRAPHPGSAARGEPRCAPWPPPSPRIPGPSTPVAAPPSRPAARKTCAGGCPLPSRTPRT